MVGIRIIVGNVDECYRTLGLVHGLYRRCPAASRITSRSARQRLPVAAHLAVRPEGTPIEVQIRTEDMQRLAESGIAAHWQYKTGENGGEAQQARARRG